MPPSPADEKHVSNGRPSHIIVHKNVHSSPGARPVLSRAASCNAAIWRGTPQAIPIPSDLYRNQSIATSAAAAASGKRPSLKVSPPQYQSEPLSTTSHAHSSSISSTSSANSVGSNPRNETIRQRLWFRNKSGGSATSLIVSSNELVDDVKIRILQKYPTSLQQRCDPADLVMTVSQSSGVRLELQPDEDIIDVMDKFFPEGMKMKDALEVGPSASMWCSPMQQGGSGFSSGSRDITPRSALQRARSYSNTQSFNTVPIAPLPSQIPVQFPGQQFTSQQQSHSHDRTSGGVTPQASTSLSPGGGSTPTIGTGMGNHHNHGSPGNAKLNPTSHDRPQYSPISEHPTSHISPHSAQVHHSPYSRQISQNLQPSQNSQQAQASQPSQQSYNGPHGGSSVYSSLISPTGSSHSIASTSTSSLSSNSGGNNAKPTSSLDTRSRQKRSTESSVLLLPRNLPVGRTSEKFGNSGAKLVPLTGTDYKDKYRLNSTASIYSNGIGEAYFNLDSHDGQENQDGSHEDGQDENNNLTKNHQGLLLLQQQLAPSLHMVHGKPTVVPQINILIVEDNPVNQKILEAFMKRKKVRYDVANNGREALEKWKVGGFHLILMDIQLPVMTGLEATTEIRRLEIINGIGALSQEYKKNKGSQKPAAHEVIKKSAGGFRSPVIIVALTASSDSDDKSDALAAGCNDFLTKPVNFMWLEKKIIEWGCMQALIDFDGWKKWSDDGKDSTDNPLSTSPSSTSATSKNRRRNSNRQVSKPDIASLAPMVQAP